MNINSSRSFPEIPFPTIYVNPLGEDIWDDLSYIPILSTIKGAGESFVGVACLATSIALSIISLIAIPIAFVVTVSYSFFKGPLDRNESNEVALFFAIFAGGLIAKSGSLAYKGINLLANGIIKSVPIVSNLVLGFANGRIQIIQER